MTLMVWLTLPICAAIFLAVVGIPLWLVLRRPEQGPVSGWATETRTASHVPALAPAQAQAQDRAPARARHRAPAGAQGSSPARRRIDANR
jgi:hypothetical protein